MEQDVNFDELAEIIKCVHELVLRRSASSRALPPQQAQRASPPVICISTALGPIASLQGIGRSSRHSCAGGLVLFRAHQTIGTSHASTNRLSSTQRQYSGVSLRAYHAKWWW